MTTRTLRYGKGYIGKLGNRCWIARITGSDATYGLSREFLDPASVKREHHNRARTIVNFSYELEPNGLYELSEEGERWIIGVLPQNDGSQKAVRLSSARVKTWAQSLDEGRSDKQARLDSKGL